MRTSVAIDKAHPDGNISNHAQDTHDTMIGNQPRLDNSRNNFLIIGRIVNKMRSKSNRSQKHAYRKCPLTIIMTIKPKIRVKKSTTANNRIRVVNWIRHVFLTAACHCAPSLYAFTVSARCIVTVHFHYAPLPCVNTVHRHCACLYACISLWVSLCVCKNSFNWIPER